MEIDGVLDNQVGAPGLDTMIVSWALCWEDFLRKGIVLCCADAAVCLCKFYGSSLPPRRARVNKRVV